MKVTDEWLYEKMPIVDAAMVRQLEVCTQKDYVFSDKFRKRMKRLIQKEKYMYAEKQLKKITQKIAAAAGVMLVGVGSTHRHDECGGLPGTVFSYDKNGAGW